MRRRRFRLTGGHHKSNRGTPPSPPGATRNQVRSTSQATLQCGVVLSLSLSQLTRQPVTLYLSPYTVLFFLPSKNKRPSASHPGVPPAYGLLTTDHSLQSQHRHQFLHTRRALLQRRILFRRQLDLDDFLGALRPQLHRHADEQSINPVFAFQIDGAR